MLLGVAFAQTSTEGGNLSGLNAAQNDSSASWHGLAGQTFGSVPGVVSVNAIPGNVSAASFIRLEIGTTRGKFLKYQPHRQNHGKFKMARIVLGRTD